jgi:hypothetical protein
MGETCSKNEGNNKSFQNIAYKMSESTDLGKPKSRWENKIIYQKYVKWIQLAYYKVQWWATVMSVMDVVVQ